MKILNSIKKNTILLLIITTIVLYIVLKDDMNDIVKAFKIIDIKFILLALIFYFFSIVIKGYVNYKIVNDKKNLSLKEAIKHNLITQFFNGITPFSTGGQPMEIYMLTEHNISLANATSQTVQSFIFYQIALVICGFLGVLYNFFFHIFPKVQLLQHLVIIGFIINITIAIISLLVSYSKKIANKIGNIIIKISKKIKKEINEEEIRGKLNDFYLCGKSLRKRKKLFVVGIVLNVGSLLCLYISPLFILYSMKDFTNLTVLNTITASAYVYLIGGFVPIPGGSGGIEYVFTQFYGNFISLTKISAVLLLWRFITYYLGMIIGALIFNIEKKVK